MDLLNSEIGPEDNQLKFKTVLFKGKYGSVYLMTDYNDKLCVAKQLLKSRHRTNNEMQINKIVEHPNILKSNYILENHDSFFLIMDYSRYGSLTAELEKKQKLEYRDVLIIGRQISSALCYLHDKNIIHRDIKTGNIVRSADDQVKLIDFGVSLIIINDNEKSTDVVGTKGYMAPELNMKCAKLEGYYPKPVDAWSLGITLYVLLKGEMPFAANIKHYDYTMINRSGLPPSISKFMEMACVRDPKNRSTMKQLRDYLSFT